jgi:hypothetical protein
MILSDLIGAVARCEGKQVGHVVDARLTPSGPEYDQPMPRLKIHGLLISPHTNSATLGYERTEVRSPWPLAAFDRWRHRDSFLVLWDDIERNRCWHRHPPARSPAVFADAGQQCGGRSRVRLRRRSATERGGGNALGDHGFVARPARREHRQCGRGWGQRRECRGDRHRQTGTPSCRCRRSVSNSPRHSVSAWTRCWTADHCCSGHSRGR